jgi:FAD-dependent urate hydroxylase
MSLCDVAIVGAGPYGLSAAAHLRAMGLDIRVFGRTMAFWEHNMPTGMFLRSPWVASHLSEPDQKGTLDSYCQASAEECKPPIPVQSFVSYGKWFQANFVPNVDARIVSNVNQQGREFRLLLEDGEEIKARRVVVAAGIEKFARKPRECDHLPCELVSHSVENREFSAFRGMKVLVIGGGQSALESAALLHESGADVEIVMRGSQVRFLHEREWLHREKIVARLLYASPDVGPALVSHLVARPNLFKKLPRRMQDRLHPRSIRPAGAQWLKPRLKNVPITCDRSLSSIEPGGSWAKVKLDDGSTRQVNHVLLATGYKVDITQYAFLAGETLDAISRTDSYPRLNSDFESTVPGLYFIGAPAAWTFGPLLRFVAGADFAATSVARAIGKSIRYSNGKRNA